MKKLNILSLTLAFFVSGAAWAEGTLEYICPDFANDKYVIASPTQGIANTYSQFGVNLEAHEELTVETTFAANKIIRFYEEKVSLIGTITEFLDAISWQTSGSPFILRCVKRINDKR